MPTVRIGLSGWNYPPWRGDFYPRDLARKDELAYAARAFDTLEINGTFYSLRKPADFRRWRQAAPSGFVYLRLHGPRALYASSYSEDELDRWTGRIRSWASGGEADDARRITDRRPPPRQGRDVYVYFNNDDGGHAFRDARRLRERLA